MKEFKIFWENEEYSDYETIEAEWEEDAIEEVRQMIPADAIITKIEEVETEEFDEWAHDSFLNLGLSQWDFIDRWA